MSWVERALQAGCSHYIDQYAAKSKLAGFETKELEMRRAENGKAARWYRLGDEVWGPRP